MLTSLVLVAILAVSGVFSDANATSFTTTVPGTAITIPTTYPQAGGVVIVLEGTNGNVYYQFINPSTMFQGYQNTGTPAAYQGNPFQIGPVMTLNCGPVTSCSTYLGGGVTRASIRFTAYDGDSQAGMFDFNNLNLQINGSNFGASSGNWSVVATQNTDVTGTTLIGSATGFGNNTFDTGWFQSTDPAILTNILTTGSVTAKVLDSDPNDNLWDFRRGNDAVTGVVPLNVAPGVTLDKTSGTPTFTSVGQVVTYNYALRNIGSVWIENFSVSDNKAGTVTCPATRVNPGETLNCTKAYTITQADFDNESVTNTATAIGSPQAGSLGPVTDAVTITGPAGSPAIDVSKTAAPSPFGVVGSTITYTFPVRNTGNVTLTNIVVTDPLIPAFTCSIAALAPGITNSTCTATYTVKQSDLNAGSIVNTASVTSRAPKGATITDTGTRTTPGPTQTRSLFIDKTSPTATYSAVGNTISYSYLIRNTGNVTLTTAITVADNKTTVTCPAFPVTGLAPNATVTCSATYSVTQADLNAGNVTNIASAASGATTSPTDSVTVNATQNRALTVDKTSSTTSFNAVGDTVSYSYLVRNTGNVTLTQPVTVADNKTAVSCPALPPGGLTPNATLTCTATYVATQVDLNAGGVTNIGSATSGPTTSPIDTVTVPAAQTRSMTMDKTATAVNFVGGGSVTYQYVVANTGNVTLTAPVTVTDNRITPVNCPALPPGGLAPNATLTCAATYAVTGDDLDIGSITNIAQATSGATTSPQDSVTVPTGANPALTIVKSTATTGFNNVGDVITYTYTVTNTGNVSFTRQIRVNDDKAGNFLCFTATPGNPLNPLEVGTCNRSYTVTQTDLDNGSVTNQANASTTYGIANLPVTSPLDDVTVNATQDPELATTKSVTTLPVTTVGQVLTYSITVANTGDVTVRNITVSDPLIPALSCTIATLAPAASNNSCVGTYTVTQANFNAGTINNTATATGETPQGATVTDTGALATPITQNSSVTIAKVRTGNLDEDGSGSVTRNDTLTYSVTVTNDGNITQSNVVVSDPKLTPNTRTCATLAPGATCILNGAYVVAQADVDGGSVVNTASVTTTLLPTPESSPPVTTPIPQTSALAIDKSSPTANYDATGDTLTYSYTVRNTGNTTITVAVAVNDNKTTVNCPALPPGGLLPNATLTCSAIYTIVQGDLNVGGVTNIASATSGATTSPTDQVTINAIQNPASTIAKSLLSNDDEDGNGAVSRNDTLRYRVTVTNTGNITQTNVVVADPKLSSASSISCPSVAPGGTCILNGQYTVTLADVNAGTISNTASVTSTQLPTPRTSTVNTTVPQTPALSISKSSPTTDFDAVGDTISYSYDVTNTGNVTLTNTIAVNDDKATVSCPALPPGGLDPAATITCSATHVVTQGDLDSGFVTNIATARSGATTSPSDSVTVNANQLPAMTVTKTSSTPSYDSVGDSLNYSYVVRNTGNVTLTSAISVADDKTTVNCPALPPAGLAPNATLTCTATYTVNQADIDAGAVVNTASATSGVTTSPTDQASVPAVKKPRMNVTKVAPPVAFITTGQTITYTYNIENTGNTTFTSVLEITDDRIGTFTCFTPTVPDPFSPGETVSCTADYTVTSGDVDIGTITNLAVGKSGPYTSPQTSTTIPQASAPALTTAKTVVPAAATFDQAGDVLTYSYTITNSGGVTLIRPIQIEDDKSGTFNCYVPNGANPDLTPGESVICNRTYTVTLADMDAGQVTNQANARTTHGAANTPVVSPPDAVTVLAIQNPGLTVTKSAATLPVTAVGQILAYTIAVENSGDVTVTNINVSDPLIPSLACVIASLAPGANDNTCVGTYTVTQADVDAGSIVNTASASGTTPQGGSVAGTGNLTTAMPAANPQVVVTKSASPPDYTDVGQPITYRFTVENTGNVTLGSLNVTDPLIPSLSCTIATLAPGTTNATCTGIYTITQADIDNGTRANTASVTADAARGVDPSDTGSLTINGPPREPGVSINKIANQASFNAPGQVLTYDYVVGNTGNTTLTVPATVTDDLISPLTCPAWPAAGLGPNQTWTCTGSYTTTQADVDAGGVTNVARVVSGTPLGPLTPPDVSVTVPAVQNSTISINKAFVSAVPLPVALGSVISYTVTATNSGNVTQSNVVVSDPLLTPASITCDPVSPGGTCVLTGTLTVSQTNVDDGFVKNTASVQSALVPPVNSSEVTTSINQGSSFSIGKAFTNADEDASGDITTGDTLTYTVTAANSGNVTQSNVVVFDAFLTPDTQTCATLAPAATCVLTGIYVVQQADADAGKIVNTATVKSTLIPAPVPTTLSTPLPQVNTMSVVKVQTANADGDASGSITVGDVLEYTITVTNTGTVTQNVVVVSDAKITPNTLTCPSVPRTGTCVLVGNHTVTQAEVDAGKIDNVASAVSDKITTPVSTTLSTPVAQIPAVALVKGQPALEDKNKNGLPDAGEALVYPFTVTNTGNVTLTNITVADGRAGVTLTGNPIATLAPGASSSAVKARYTIKQADINAGSITNSATVAGNPPTGPPVTDTSDDDSTAGNDPTVSALKKEPRVALAKAVTSNKDEDKSGFVSVGDTLTYTVTATNTGNVSLTNVAVNDTRIAPASKSCATLLPGKSCTLVGTYKVTKADLAAKKIDNTASVTSNELTASVTATATTKVSAKLLANQFTKTALNNNIRRGERVAWVIELFDTPVNPATIVDRMPPGFAYVAGSSRVNGVALEPSTGSQRLTYANITPDGADNFRIELTLVATANVATGPNTNIVELYDVPGGILIGSAKSTVTVTPEHVFDCGELIGKVFDDKNRNGYQDQGEPGLPGVRLATVNGLLITTDKHGRYHVACADIPDKDIGSNFILKVDPRTLPTGYRFTTENPRTVRLTRGKITKLNFGATISRVIRLDINGKVFIINTDDLKPEWLQAIDVLIDKLDSEPSTIRITYYLEGEDIGIAQNRLRAIEALIAARWREHGGRYKLPIESRILEGYRRAAK